MILWYQNYWLEDIFLKQLVGNISPKPWPFSYRTTLTIQYLYTKSIKFDVSTYVYDDIGISVDTWNFPQVVSKIMEGTIFYKKIFCKKISLKNPKIVRKC